MLSFCVEVQVEGVAGEGLRQTKGIELRRVLVKSFYAKGLVCVKAARHKTMWHRLTYIIIYVFVIPQTYV